MRIRISTKKPARYHIRAERIHEIHTPFTEKSRSTTHTVRTSATEPDQYDFKTAIQRARSLGVASHTSFGSEAFTVKPTLRVERLALKIGPVSLFKTVNYVPFELHDLSQTGRVAPLPGNPSNIAGGFEQTT